MFKDVFVLGKLRTKKEAFGFYLAHLLSGMIIAFAMGMIYGMLLETRGLEAGFQNGLNSGIGQILAFVYTAVLSVALLRAKHFWGETKYVFLSLLALVLSGLLGLIGGLIIPAVLTTKSLVSNEPAILPHVPPTVPPQIPPSVPPVA